MSIKRKEKHTVMKQNTEKSISKYIGVAVSLSETLNKLLLSLLGIIQPCVGIHSIYV